MKLKLFYKVKNPSKSFIYLGIVLQIITLYLSISSFIESNISEFIFSTIMFLILSYTTYKNFKAQDKLKEQIIEIDHYEEVEE